MKICTKTFKWAFSDELPDELEVLEIEKEVDDSYNHYIYYVRLVYKKGEQFWEDDFYSSCDFNSRTIMEKFREYIFSCEIKE